MPGARCPAISTTFATRPTLERAWRKPKAERKSPAWRKPMDAAVMFKTLVLGAL